MPNPVEAMTTATLSLALDAAARRQEVLAANIANASVDGYRSMRVAFESTLADARQAVRDNGTVDQLSLSSARISVEPAVDAQGQTAKVQLDVQMAEMARNAVQFQALTQGLSRHLSFLAMAAADGKR